MSAKANPVRIGGFVVGAVALVLVGLVVFGSGRVFEKRQRFVAFFDGSVTGLQAGAPVAFRGVPIGAVTSVQVRYDPSNQTVEVPVFFETSGGVDVVDVVDDVPPEAVAEEVQKMIGFGLRARLAPQSFVTGQLYVELSIHPDTPAKLVGTEPGAIEIPTIPSQLEVLSTRLESMLGSGQAGQGITGVTDGINELLGEQNQQAVAETLAGLARFARTLGESDGNLAETLKNSSILTARGVEAVTELKGLISDAREAVKTYDDVAAKVVENEDEVREIVSTFQATTESVGRAADQINAAVAENRPGLHDFSEHTLSAVDGLVLDLEQLTRKLNRVADNLERDPSGFLFGGRTPRGIQTP